MTNNVITSYTFNWPKKKEKERKKPIIYVEQQKHKNDNEVIRRTIEEGKTTIMIDEG